MTAKLRNINAPDIQIRQMLLKEHSKKQCLRIADYIGNDQLRFDALMHIFLTGPYRVTQRAAWPLSVCVERYPLLAKSHMSTLVKALGDESHPAIRRNVLRSLQYLKIPKRYYSKLVELCESMLRGNEPVAIQVFAMEIWAQIAEVLPELQTELCTTLEERLPYGSAGYRSRAMKILRRLKWTTRVI